MTMKMPKTNRWSSLPVVVLVFCVTLFVTVANVWMSVEQQVVDIRPPLVLDGSTQREQEQEQQQQYAASPSSLLEEAQRLLETALVKANRTRTQMAAEIAKSRQQITELQGELENVLKKEREAADHSGQRRREESKTSIRPKMERNIIPHHTKDSPEAVTLNKAIASPFIATASTNIITKTSTTSTEESQQAERTNQHDDTISALGPVQAWAEGDIATAISSRRLLHGKTYTNVADIPYIPFDNTTLNPVLPSMKVNSATMWNIEIPLNYSITADMKTTIPWSNVSTLAFYQGRFYSGFRNQIMVFTVLVMEAARQRPQHHVGQLLLRSVRMKDTFGTNKMMEFAKLWDVAHWNSHYPRLPRLVDYDPILHSQFNYQESFWHRTTSALPDHVHEQKNGSTTRSSSTTTKEKKWFGAHGLFASKSPTRPHAFGLQHHLSGAYMRYATKGRGPYAANTSRTTTTDHSNTKSHNNNNNNKPLAVGFRNPIEILMMQGAMRPHPNFQAIIDRLLAESGLEKDNGNDYMTLHARVEPDMQNHPVCRDKKVLNLTVIFDFIEQKWLNAPPVSRIFMPINRQYMEKEGHVNKNDPSKTNWIAVQNLNALNHARDYGLWGGRVKVLEFGANALDNTTYADRPSTGGAMLNFFLGIGAKIFIGTEVSSYSHDLLATRFYRSAKENYKYLPDGLHEWTPPGTMDPPGFGC